MRKYEKEKDELVKCSVGDKHLHLKRNAVRRDEGQCVEVLSLYGAENIFQKETKRKEVSEKQVGGRKTVRVITIMILIIII